MVSPIAIIVTPIVGRYLNKLAEFLEEKACKILGVKDELKKLQRRLQRIRGVLEEAEKKGSQDADISTWLKELKDVMYDAEDIIDLCMIKGSELLEDHPSTSLVRCNFSVLPCLTTMPFRHEIATRIKDVNDRLKEVMDDSAMSKLVPANPGVWVSEVKTRETVPLLVESDIVGRAIEDSTQMLVEAIIREEGQKCFVFAIVGMGGIGKTTLANKVYNDEKIASSFPIRMWVCVTKQFDERQLLKEIIISAGGSCGQRESKAQLAQHLASILTERFLLVLDDVWRDVWEDFLRIPFENGKARGRVVVTTRDETVARSMRASIHHVKKMNDSDCWELLCKRAFGDEEEEDMDDLRAIGMEIVKKCDGLPLAISAIAGVLRSKDRTRMVWEKVARSDAWSMAHLPEELRGALYLSYEDLPSDLKQCFLFCSLLPQGRIMYNEDLIRYWMAEGFLKTEGEALMEDVGKEYYMELVRRSLLQFDPRYADRNHWTMHDLLHALCRFLTREENTLGDTQSLGTNPVTKLRRLSVMNMTERAVIPDAIINQKCLRTLMFFKSPEAKTFECIFQRFKCLRVLDLCDTGIECLPDFVENLVHLRLLDLDRTRINKLPESIGSLRNLQTLNISDCESLHELPKGITRLCNLRCLRVWGTPLSHVPRGIGKLKNLFRLEGFVVGNNGSTSDRQDGCSLEELQSLPQLRYLRIDRLEMTQKEGALAFANNSFLRELHMACTLPPSSNQPTYAEEASQRIEEIYQELSPPPSLQTLIIVNYFGHGFPTWMLSSTLGSSFPCLTVVKLIRCRSCLQLPPLGQLPQLTYLQIKGADAIVHVGPEFLGSSATSRTVFPKLEYLRMEKMRKWEEWSLDGAEKVHDGRTSSATPKLLPRLKQLNLIDCPKLRALPQGLRYANNLQTMIIRGAYQLGGIENLLSVQDIEINDNCGLESISNLPSARRLVIIDCPNLKRVEGLDALRQLQFVYSQTRQSNTTNADFRGVTEITMDCLLNWLSGLAEQRQQAQAHTSATPQDLKLILRCPKDMFLRCPKGCSDWQIIQHMSWVDAATNNELDGWLMYTKMPLAYETNVSVE